MNKSSFFFKQKNICNNKKTELNKISFLTTLFSSSLLELLLDFLRCRLQKQEYSMSKKSCPSFKIYNILCRMDMIYWTCSIIGTQSLKRPLVRIRSYPDPDFPRMSNPDPFFLQNVEIGSYPDPGVKIRSGSDPSKKSDPDLLLYSYIKSRILHASNSSQFPFWAEEFIQRDNFRIKPGFFCKMVRLRGA